MTTTAGKTVRPAAARSAAPAKSPAVASGRQVSAAYQKSSGKPQAASGPAKAKAAKAVTVKAEKKANPRKKRGMPIIEIVVILLLVKIGASAYYMLSSPAEESAGEVASISAITSLPQKLFALIGFSPEKNNGDESSSSTVDGYLAAAASAVSPAVAQASTPAASLASASAVSQNAVAAGAFMVIGSQAATGDVARTGTPAMPPTSTTTSIPLPPGGDDLLTPAAELPPPPLPELSVGATGDTSLPGGLAGESVPAPAQLRSREQEIAQKEAMLNTKEEALRTLEVELNRRLDAMETTRAEIQSMTQRNEAILDEQKALREQQKKDDEMLRDARIEHLVIAYKGMKAEQAGNLINSMDDDVAVAILSAMPGRNAGLILANVIPEKAARLTKAISEKRIDPNLLLANEPAAE